MNKLKEILKLCQDMVNQSRSHCENVDALVIIRDFVKEKIREENNNCK